MGVALKREFAGDFAIVVRFLRKIASYPSAKRHLTWSGNIQPYAKVVRQRGGSMRGFKAARCSAMQLKCGRIEKAGPRVETHHSALQMVCVSYLTQAEGGRSSSNVAEGGTHGGPRRVG